jgi:sulfate adenylyltransferase subunit 2
LKPAFAVVPAMRGRIHRGCGSVGISRMSGLPVSKNDRPAGSGVTSRLSARLRDLEAEAIYILREAAAELTRPVMLYSIGKDSSVMVHLAMKAFHPARIPFPLLHIDTTWKFRDMIAFRDRRARELGVNLIVHVNERGRHMVNPFDTDSSRYTQVMKTDALKDALAAHGFDGAIGGARRDEEKSRAKERIFSFRSQRQGWDPKSQRPELWNLFNCRLNRGESFRVFPLSNWTELDVWKYIEAENIPVVPLYFAALRPSVVRDGAIIVVDDDRMQFAPGETPQMRQVRFRSLGCYPLTGAVESAAQSVADVICELETTSLSERATRLIDHDQAASMERKKREGYF